MRLLVALVTLALAPAALAAPQGPDAAEIWKAKCKSCHGVDGKAQTRMGKSHHIVDLSSPEFQSQHTDAQIRAVIENGSKKDSKMKAFKGRLSEEEITALVRYIRALKSSQP